MINCWRVIVIFCLASSIFTEAVNVCSVQPTATVVVVGKEVSLNCTANGDFSILSWQIGTDVNNKTVVYTAPSFGRNETVIRNQSIADGYSVTNVAENKTLLYINQIKVSQAGLYVCQCGDQSLSTATTAVVVLASEPTFSIISSDTNGKEVSFSCNVSFNRSANISSNLTIKDVSGSIVQRTLCFPNNALTFCNLKYTITANASVDQSHTCTVQLITINNIIYSRVVSTSLEWARVSSAEIVVSNPSKCSAKKCVVNESITCRTDGTPGITDFKWWQTQYNGSKLQIIGDGSQYLVLNEVGQFTYQCQVYNKIQGVTYNAISKTFTINVTGSDANQVIALPIGIAVACLIIATLSAATIVLYRKLRQRSASDAIKISTEDSPALYAALDLQTASEEQKRGTYTAIQFPIKTQQDLGGDYVNIDFSCEYETVN